MNTNIHHYITELLKGNVLPEEPRFALDEHYRAVDREDYQQYLPDICRFIETEKQPFKLAIGRLILERIVPDHPDARTTKCLLGGLANPDRISRELLLSHLPALRFPEGTDLEPIKERVRKGEYMERTHALEAMCAGGEDGEAFLIDVLRKTNERYDVQTIAEVLADCGGIFAIPVLMARLEKGDVNTNVAIYDALERIAARLDMPQDIKEKLSDPDFWKVRWQGSKESFAGFMSFIAMMSGSGDNQEAADQIAEIFIAEMDVDIAPFESFKALRLCSSGEDMFSVMAGMKDHLESKILLEVALSDTGVTESKESQFQDIYFDMMNDYLFTRLRRKIQFADDAY